MTATPNYPRLAAQTHAMPDAVQASDALRAPMAAAPIVYNDDQSVAWDRMWTTFCVLASAGGPPHRGTILQAETASDPNTPAYAAAAAEIIRGILLVSGLNAQTAQPGWIAITCQSAAQARWLSEQINAENVESRWDGKQCLVPVGKDFSLTAEVKNVVTAVAKTTHYWREHLAPEVKQTLAVETVGLTLLKWLRRK